MYRIDACSGMNNMMKIDLLNNRLKYKFASCVMTHSSMNDRSAGATLSITISLSQPLKTDLLPFRNKREELSRRFPTSLSSHLRTKPGPAKWSGGRKGSPTPDPVLEELYLECCPPSAAFLVATGLMPSSSDPVHMCPRRAGQIDSASSWF